MPNYYPGRFEEPAIVPGNPFADEPEAIAMQAEEQRLASPRMYHPERMMSGKVALHGAFGGPYIRAGATEEQIRELIRRHPSYFLGPDLQRAPRPDRLPGEY